MSLTNYLKTTVSRTIFVLLSEETGFVVLTPSYHKEIENLSTSYRGLMWSLSQIGIFAKTEKNQTSAKL